MKIRDIQQYIEEKQLLHHNTTIIVGVSGGADSIALLHILIALGYKCIVAHCNFHLRGDESLRDENFVVEFCTQRDIPLEIINFETEEYAKLKSISIEMAARELRYTWFEEIRLKYNAQAIAIAHHMDDSVETVLLNLIRGTGIRGLTGIQVKNKYIVRPLLNTTRSEIIDYLDQQSISYVDDSTNLEDIYTRNKIRLNILPLMETINPSVKCSINQTANRLRQVQNIYDDYISKAKTRVLNADRINIKQLLNEKEPQTILFEILAGYGYNGDIVENVFNSLTGESGKVFYSETHRLLKDREVLVIEQLSASSNDGKYYIEENCRTITLPLHLFIDEIETKGEIKIGKSNRILYLDKSKLKYPLTIRRWQEGDWFIPFGMQGRKKISDFFTDLKFSLFEKENAWLLCSDDDVIWIIGYRSDNRYKIDDSIQNIVKITLS